LQAIAVMPHCSATIGHVWNVPVGRPEERAMRLILGMILGAALTVGVAYVSDTATKPNTPGADARPMVNWDVVGRNVDALTTMIKQGWNKLTGDKA
jgi:hypothetical protein